MVNPAVFPPRPTAVCIVMAADDDDDVISLLLLREAIGNVSEEFLVSDKPDE